jgi:hypothetical protein
MVKERQKKSKVKTLKAESVAPDKAKQVEGGPSGQPWRGSSIAHALEKVGE